MSQPLQRMIPDDTIPLRDIRPFGICPQPHKYARRSLVRTQSEYNLVSLVEDGHGR